MCQNWGYERLHGHTKMQSIDEMKHAEALIERILFLDGVPNLSELLPLKIGANIKAQIENDLALELGAVASYNDQIKLCREAGDNASRELFEKLLADEEEHVDWLEAQLHQITEVGLDRYLSQQIRKE
jgi:bacterioferritin